MSCRPDFSLLIYPAYLVEQDSAKLVQEVPITKETPPAFLVHAHDDGVTPLSSIAYYAALRQLKIPAELHVFANGGHGYGLRPVDGSDVDTWPVLAENWLRQQGIIETPAN